MAQTQPLRPYLEYQADRVEALLAAHQAPARIAGGTVGPRLIRFFLQPAPHIRFATIRNLADDLALALRVPQLLVQRGPEGIVLEFANPEPQSVELRALLPTVQPLPPATALLGLTDDGRPLLARLPAPDVAHVLVAGTTGSGKSQLLRTLAASLVLSQPPALLQLLCLDPKGRTFAPFQHAPHLARPLVTTPAAAAEALASLVRLMEFRDRHAEDTPRLIVLIDELADLLFQAPALGDPLTRLAQRGRQAGIHLVAATQRPSAAFLSPLLRANFPLRLVGKVVSPEDARVAAGRGGTEAHLLQGRGDFLAVGPTAQPLRFQVARIAEAELRQAFPAPARAPLALPGPLATMFAGARSRG